MLKFGSKSDINVTYKCTVRLLEDTEVVECEFQTHHKGKFVVEYVCRQLNLIEKDYFGLRYVDSNKQRHWLDLAKTVMKQVKDMDPILFSFRVKFYPPDPFRLKEEITRYQIYLQLKRDLLHGRLYCTQEEASLLGAYVLQSEIGDYDPEEHVDNYVSEFKLLLKQTILIEEKIVEIHSTQLKGQTPAEAETNFLRKAYLLDTYGVDPHPVKDHRGNQLYLGINHLGILTFQGSRKTHHFKWNEVQKINYEGKMFIVHLTFNEKKHTVGFKCPTGAACRHVWRCAVEQMLFFTLPSSSEAPSVVTGGSFFSWGTKFRYSGRVEREIMEDLGPLRREEPPINRSRPPSLRRKASSVPATPSTPVGSDIGEIRYSSLPRANHSAPLPDTRLDGSLLCGVDLPLSSPYCPDNTLPLLETVAEDQEINNKKGPAEEPNAIETHDSNVLAEHEKMDAHVDHTDFGLNQDANTEVEKRPDNKKIETEIIGNNLGAQPNNILSPTSEPSSEKGGIDGSHGIDSGGSHGSYSDYYFRDSFDHSSSESQLDVGTHKHASHRHDAYGQSQGTPTPLHLKSGSSKSTLQQRKFNLIHVFIPSFLFVVFALAILVIVVLESDSELLSSVRRMPEMVVLRKDYYEPMKEYLKQRLGKLL